MAFSAVAARGTGASSTSGNTLTCTPGATIAVGQYLLLAIAADNIATTDGASSNVTSVTDANGNTWDKLGEYTNGEGAAGSGITTALFGCKVTTQLANTTTITVTFSGNITDKCCTLHEFTVSGGVSLAATAVGNATDAAAGFGSASISGLSSGSRLYFRALAKEANSTTALTATTNFTANAGTRSRNNASAVLVRAEFRINTSTGETSNPTLAVTGDTAGVFVALNEVTGYTGDLAATESGSDTFTSSGYPFRPLIETLTDAFSGSSLDSTKWHNYSDSGCGPTVGSGVLTQSTNATAFGYCKVAGDFNLWNLEGSGLSVRLNRPLQGSYTSGGAECVIHLYDPPLSGPPSIAFGWENGNLIARYNKVSDGSWVYLNSVTYSSTNHQWLKISESGGTITFWTAPDSSGSPGTWTSFATVAVSTLDWPIHSLVTQLDTGIYSTLSGGTGITGGAQWSQFNTAVATATGTLAATESGADTFASTGAVAVAGSLAVSESGSDTLAASGSVPATGSLAVSEAGSDTFAATGSVPATGSLAVTEAGADTFASTGAVKVAGSLGATESGSDTFAADGTVTSSGVTGDLGATESGADAFSSTGYPYAPLLQTLQDAFGDSSIDFGKWHEYSDSGCSVTEGSGVLSQTINSRATGYAKLAADFNFWNLTGSHCTVRLHRPIQGSWTGGAAETIIHLYNAVMPVGNAVAFGWENGDLVARYFSPVDGWHYVTAGAYDSTNHQWLRISESGGTITWWTAPDNGGSPGTWTSYGTVPVVDIGFPITNLVFQLDSGIYATLTGGTGVTGTAQWSNLSIPYANGALAATEAGSDTLAATGAVAIAGSLGATESGADTLAATGAVAVAGSLAVSESGSDTAAATGTVVVAGSLAVSEAGADTFASTGAVKVAGSLAVSEAGADAFASTGTAGGSTGSMAATESGADTLASSGAVAVAGNLAPTEANDTLAATGGVLVSGSAAATESGTDTFAGSISIKVFGLFTAVESADTLAATGAVAVAGSAAASESGADAFASSGAVEVSGTVGAVETDHDTFQATAGTTATGNLAAVESGSDGFASSGLVEIAGAVSAVETTADTFAGAGGVTVAGSVAASEARDVLAISGAVEISGAATATETSNDFFASIGVVPVAGAVNATESGSDGFAASGGLPATGSLAATEGNDTFASTGFQPGISGSLIVSEAGADGFAATGGSFITGALAASEAGSDTFNASSYVAVTGTVSALEAGADTFAAAGGLQGANGVPQLFFSTPF